MSSPRDLKPTGRRLIDASEEDTRDAPKPQCFFDALNFSALITPVSADFSGERDKIVI